MKRDTPGGKKGKKKLGNLPPKNSGNSLSLSSDDISRIAAIDPNAIVAVDGRGNAKMAIYHRPVNSE